MKLKGMRVLLLACLGFVSPVFAQQVDDTHSCDSLINDLNSAKAQSCFNKLHEANPDSSDILVGLAESFAIQGDNDGCEQANNYLQKINFSQLSNPLKARVDFISEMCASSDDEQKTHFTQATQLDPSFLWPYFGLKDPAVVKQGMDLAHAQNNSPMISVAYMALAASSNDSNNRLENLNNAIQFNPNNFLAYSERSGIFQDEKKYTEALADIDHMIQLNPNSDQLYAQRCDVDLLLKHYSQALDDLQKAFDINPAWKYQEKMAQVNIELKHYPEALANYQQNQGGKEQQVKGDEENFEYNMDLTNLYYVWANDPTYSQEKTELLAKGKSFLAATQVLRDKNQDLIDKNLARNSVGVRTLHVWDYTINFYQALYGALTDPEDYRAALSLVNDMVGQYPGLNSAEVTQVLSEGLQKYSTQ